MQYTENYQYRKPVIGIDVADVKDINFNSDKTDTLIHNTQISLAPAYDLTKTYDTGDVVMYETLMYKCKEDNVTGAWDASKWERTTAGEEGAGGGGGSSVIPNPQGEPTDTLETIEIDGTIFDIAGSGGGGVSAYEETTLWSGSDSASMTLSESFENYDAIMVVAKTSYNNTEYSMSAVWLTSYLSDHINDGMRFGLTGDSWYIYFSITDNTTFVRQDQYSLYISEIKGLKFGGGDNAGGGLERTLLWDYVTDNNNVIPYGLYTETLHDDIDNYDFIVAEIVSASGDLSASGWEGTNLWTIDVNALNNTEVQNYLNYTSFGERSSRFYIKDTTFQKTTDNQANTNGLVRVYGLKWTGGGSGASSEIIPISAGDGTTNRTFTFDKTPKSIQFYWDDPVLEGRGWIGNGLFVWGQEYITFPAHTRASSVTGMMGGCAVLSYGADGKSVTINAANAFQALNTPNGSGLMFVDYGGGGGSSGGYSETDLFVNTGSSNPSSIVMNDSIQNYDEIVFKVTRNAYGNTYKLQYRYLTSELELGDQIQCWCWGPNNEYFSYILTAFDTLSDMAQGNALLCTKIIGIKH